VDRELGISLATGLDGQLTMPKRDQRPESIKDDSSTDCSVHVQFTKVFDTSKTSLVELEDVFLLVRMASRAIYMTYLHSNPDILHGLIQHADPEFGMVSLQIKYESSNESDIPIFQFPDIRECLEQVVVHLIFSFDQTIRPIELTSGSSQCSFLRYLRTLSIVRLTSTLCIKCWIQLSIGDNSTTSLVTLSGGLHCCQPRPHHTNVGWIYSIESILKSNLLPLIKV
jgi:hypothetical protein